MDKEKIIGMLDRVIEYLLYLMVFFIPISKAGIEIVFGITTALFIIKKILRPQFTFIKNATFLFLLIFFTFCALSLFNSGIYLDKSLRALFGKWLQYITIFILVVDTLNTPRRLKNAVLVFFFTGSLIAIDAIWQKFFGIDFLRQRALVSYKFITASFENQNSLAAYLVPVLSLVLACVLGYQLKRARRFILLLSCLLIGLCLVLTSSRGAWLGFFTGLALMAFLSHKIKIFLVVVFSFTAILFLIPDSRIRIINTFQYRDSGERLELSQSALGMVRDNPFLGKGLGTFMSHFREYAHIEGIYYAHNSYLQMAAEAGVFTLLFFLLFAGSILYKAMHSFKENHDYILLGLISGVVGFLTHAFFDNHLYSLQLVVLFWFLLGLTQAAANLKEAQAK